MKLLNWEWPIRNAAAANSLKTAGLAEESEGLFTIPIPTGSVKWHFLSNKRILLKRSYATYYGVGSFHNIPRRTGKYSL